MRLGVLKAGLLLVMVAGGCKHSGSGSAAKNYSPAEAGDSATSYLLENGNLMANFGTNKCTVTNEVTSFFVPPNPDDEAVLYFLRQGELIALKKVEYSGSGCPSFGDAKSPLTSSVTAVYSHACHGVSGAPYGSYSVFAFKEDPSGKFIVRIKSMNDFSIDPEKFTSMDDFIQKKQICKNGNGGGGNGGSSGWDGDDSASKICLSLSYQSSKEDCIGKINGKHFQQVAVNVCSAFSYDSTKITCLQTIADGKYQAAAAAICNGLSYDSTKQECLGVIKDKEYSQMILDLCGGADYDSQKVSCLKTH